MEDKNWNWLPDCGGDRVLAPEGDDACMIASFYAVAWPDGDWSAIVRVSGEEVIKSGIQSTPSRSQAMAAAEQWIEERRDTLEEHINQWVTDQKEEDVDEQD